MSLNPVGKNKTVTFDGGDSSDPDGRITQYQWTVDGPESVPRSSRSGLKRAVC